MWKALKILSLLRGFTVDSNDTKVFTSNMISLYAAQPFLCYINFILCFLDHSRTAKYAMRCGLIALLCTIK